MTISPTRKTRFLESLAETGRIMESCDAADISHQTLRVWRAEDEEFAEAFIDSELRYCDKIEREIERRAIEGWDEPHFGRDEGKDAGTVVVGQKRRYSDMLLMALTKSRIAKYHDKIEAEVTHRGAVIVVPAVALDEKGFDEVLRSQEVGD